MSCLWTRGDNTRAPTRMESLQRASRIPQEVKRSECLRSFETILQGQMQRNRALGNVAAGYYRAFGQCCHEKSPEQENGIDFDTIWSMFLICLPVHVMYIQVVNMVDFITLKIFMFL